MVATSDGKKQGRTEEESFHVSFLPFHVVSKSKDASMTKTDGIQNIIYGVMVAMAADVENRTKTMK